MWDTRSPVDARQSESPRFGNLYPPRVSHIMSEHPPMTHANLQLTLSLLRRSDALKRQDGNFAAGFALVFGKTRHHLDHFGVKLAAFGLSGRGGADLEALG